MARASKDPASSRLGQKMVAVLPASLQGRQRRVKYIYIYKSIEVFEQIENTRAGSVLIQLIFQCLS